MELSDNSLAKVVSTVEALALEEFKTRIQNVAELNCPIDDVYLLRFLRYRKLDVDKAVKAVITWWEDRHNVPELYDGIYPSTFLKIYDKPAKEKFFVVLPYRDHLGRQILLWKPGNWKPAETPFLKIFESNFPIMDTISTRQLTQLKGVVVLMDFENFGFSHISSVGISDIKTVLGCTDGFPLNIKEIHMLNHSIIFNTLWSMVKIMMKSKMKQRVKFHGYNYKSLHQSVNPNLLPKKYGGEIQTDDFEEPNFTKLLLDRENYFKDLLDNRGLKPHLEKVKSKNNNNA